MVKLERPAETLAPAKRVSTIAASDAARKAPRCWLALTVILAGTFMVTLDFFVVNVAIPSIARDLHAGATAIEWVVAGYGLAYAAGLITGGRVGDLYGLRRMFMLGLAVFTLASAGCGLASSATALVLARVAQGMAAALLAPQVLAILGVAYGGADRARAFAAYGMTLGLAAVGGQLIGGCLIAADPAGLGWRSCFLVNVPVGIVALLLTPRLIAEHRGEGRGRLDLVGATLATAGLLALMWPLIEGRALGWPAGAWLCLASAPPWFLAFVAYEKRLDARGGAPLLDLALFRGQPLTLGMLIVLAFYAGVASFFLVLALYLQQGEGLDPLAAGAIFTTMGAGFMATSLAASPLGRRLGRRALAIGALLMAAGILLLDVAVAEISAGGSIALVLPGLLVDGAGMGMVTAPLVATVLTGIPPGRAGAASGVLATAQQAGNALGVAIIGAVFYGALGAGIGRDAYAHAFAGSLAGLAALALAVSVLLRFLPRRREVAEAAALPRR